MKKKTREQAVRTVTGKREKGRRRNRFPFFLTGILVLTLFSCGLASYPVLYDPIQGQSTTPVFINNPDNTFNSDFLILGYDIVYRIYDNTTVSGVPDSTIESDASQDLTGTAISAIINNDWPHMTPYRRLNDVSGTPGTSTVPLYKITETTPAAAFSIHLTIMTTDDGTDGSVSYLEDDNGNKISFNRFLGTDATEKTKNFSLSDFESTDIDVPDTYDNSDTDGVTVAFFAFTYGLTKDPLSLHGNMVYIGSVIIQ